MKRRNRGLYGSIAARNRARRAQRNLRDLEVARRFAPLLARLVKQ